MANLKKKLKNNITGNFFVDSTCIDCGTCYWIAPEVFKRDNGASHVYEQPEEDPKPALQALFSCPTNSIGVENKYDNQSRISKDFPSKITDEVFHNGYHSEKSYGATSYFIKRDKGNVLIDSPRYVKLLEDNFIKLGGVKYQYLTHQDDVADTNKYWDKFKSKRIIHKDDQNHKTPEIEILVEGEDDFRLDEDLLIIPVPGHTKGSTCLLYKNKYLFTGDHLAFSKQLNHLYAFKTACWYDFDIQIKSMEKLLNYSFEYVLPGHSAPYWATELEIKKQLEKCIAWMKA